MRAVVAFVLGVTALGSAPASAQPTGTTSEETVTRPVPRTALDAPYPSGEVGDATVVVTIVVSSDGSVVSAAAAGERSAFTAAAESAALTWRFEPATRGGRPVSATIRAQVVFRPPTENLDEPTRVAPPSASPTSAAEPPASPASPAGAAIDVTVTGERDSLPPPPDQAATLSRTEVRLMPGAFGDPFRAIEALPGVTPIVSGLPYFYVRGAPPGNVGYFIDDVRVPLLYHVALGPSVIHPELVERVDLYRGGYPASYGRFAGGIVAGETRRPSEEVRAHGNVRLFDAGALVEAPFAGGRGRALASGRYSYTAAILSLLAPDVSLSYWDYQTRLGYQVTPRDEVSVFAFGAYDFLGETPPDGADKTLFATQFHRVDVRHDHRIGSRLHLRTAVTLGTDLSEIEPASDLVSRSLRVRTSLEQRLSAGVVAQMGVDAGLNRYSVDIAGQEQNVRSLFPARWDVATGAYAGAVVRAAPSVELSPGIRVDHYGSGSAAALSFEPRVAGRFFVHDAVRIIHAYGFASQPPAFIVPVPGLDIGGLRGGLQRSFQSSAGVEWELPESISATVTGFRNAFWNTSDALGVLQGTEEDPLDAIDRRSTGTAYGLEVFVRRSFDRDLAGYLSYTLSRSTRTLDGLTFPSTFDRTHVLGGAVSYDFGRGYRAGTRATFYTGNPRRGNDAQSVDPNTGQPLDGEVAPAPDRLPPFFRLDVRFEKRWQLGKSAWLSLVLEGLNVTGSQEVIAVDCTSTGCVSETIGPVSIPNVGVEAGF